MFGISFLELVVIAVVALVFVGPNKLPELMKQLGRIFVTLRRTSNEFRDSFEKVIQKAEDEIRQEERDRLQKMLTQAGPGTTKQPPADHYHGEPEAAVAHEPSHHQVAATTSPPEAVDHESKKENPPSS